MFKSILVAVDLAETDLAKSSIETAVALARASSGQVHLLNVLPPTPIGLAEYVPPDFDEQQRRSAGELIVMSSHQPGMRTYLLGSNASHVVRYARCSVLVVRSQSAV
jgi:nucleotide-binding universal stress UspA family protein